MINDIEKRVLPVTIWRGRDDGEAPDPVLEIEAMFYYPVSDSYHIVLSDKNMEFIYKQFKKSKKIYTAAPKEIIEVADYDYEEVG